MMCKSLGCRKESDFAQPVEVADGPVPASPWRSARGLAPVLESVFPPRLHPAPIVCNLGLAALLQDRLSGRMPVAQRSPGTAECVGYREDASLFHPVLRREKVAKKRALDALFEAVFARAQACGLIGERPEGAVDATGLLAHYVSAHYLNRRQATGSFYQRVWPKLTVVCEFDSYLIAAAVVARGPSNDAAFFEEAVRSAAGRLALTRLLADKAYDSEPFHRLCREELGIASTVIPLNPRRTGNKAPTTPYRAAMHRRFPKRIYGRRWHVESVLSQHKRGLGDALRARSEPAQAREAILRVLTHNLMILQRLTKKVFNRANEVKNLKFPTKSA